MLNAPIGVLGGTFDPVHNGHLRLAIELRDMLDLAEVRLVPCARPPHRRAPTASPGQRAKWIRVAISDEPHLQLDDRELLRQGPSYTVDTLASLRSEFPHTPLCLIMGTDVFAKLPEWSRWQEVFDYGHVILVSRPGLDVEYTAAANAELDARRIDAASLGDTLSGRIHVCEPPPLAISSSHIRDLLAQGRSPRFLLPNTVFEDVTDSGIYSQ